MRRLRITHVLGKNWKTIFEQKLPVFQEKSFVACREIFSEVASPAQKLVIGS
jgi:hypothetical protein